MTDKDGGDGNVVDINKKKTNKKAEEKLSVVERYNIIDDILSQRISKLPAWFRQHPFPHVFKVIQPDALSSVIYTFEIMGDVDHPTYRWSSLNDVCRKLLAWLRPICLGPFFDFGMTFQQAQRAVEHWQGTNVDKGEIPRMITLQADTTPTLYRVPFDLKPCQDLQWNCPTWHEISERMTNWKAFCMRLASVFDHGADRKQVVYMSGPKDCGKSQIEAVIGELAGVKLGGPSAFQTISPGALKSQHWKEALIGKRVVCISEAAAYFLRTNEFKSITGDLWHSINPKGKPITNHDLPVIIFMFSNEIPEISGKDEIKERIIDCRLSHTQQSLIPDRLYQNQLMDEIPSFLGYCATLYKPYAGHRLPCENGTLEEAVDKYEANALDYFHSHWETDPDQSMSGQFVYKQFCVDRVDSRVQKEFVEIWERQLGVRRVKMTSPKKTYYYGMRKKNPSEFSDMTMNVDF